MSGELSGARFAAQIMNEVVCPLATAPAGLTCLTPDTTAGEKPHE
jgi:hypothetical protein